MAGECARERCGKAGKTCADNDEFVARGKKRGRKRSGPLPGRRSDGARLEWREEFQPPRHYASRRPASVIRPRMTKSASTRIADAPSAQFRATPSRFNAAGPAPAINPRIAAAQTNALIR